MCFNEGYFIHTTRLLQPYLCISYAYIDVETSYLVTMTNQHWKQKIFWIPPLRGGWSWQPRN